jgi:hypothetical protein
MRWTADDPGAGDVQGVKAAGRRLDSAVRSLADVHFGVRSDSGTLTAAAWEGQAGDGWREQSDACVRDLGGLIEALAGGSSALTTYANAVEGIAEEVVLVRARRVAAGADLARAMQQLGMPTSLPKNGVATPAEVARQSRVRRQARDAAQVAVDRADQEMAELVDRRVAADSTVQAALGVVDVADWRAVGGASAAAGLTSPDMIGGDATREVLVSLALDVLDGNASMADLARLLVAWGRDEEVLSGFFLSLGGGRTVALVEVLAGRVYRGEGTEVEARAQALALVSALSVGSAGWSGGQAARFVEQMTEHGRWPGAVGFLFGSAQTAPMGESFTVAMANQIDTFERVNGSPAYWQPSDGHVLANLLFPDRAGRGTDPMSGVLETLGRYPGAALDWLLDGATATSVPRVAYWVGQREWRADGHLGIAALWSGLQVQPGGPLDATQYDPEIWRRLAGANTAFAAALLANPAVLPESLSVEAQVHLATALGQMMPLLAYCLESDPKMYVVESGVLAGIVRDEHIFIRDEAHSRYEARALPLLDRESIGRLLGLAGSTSEGREVLRQGVLHAQNGLVASVLPYASPDVDAALLRVGALQAVLDGALVGSVEGIADRAAERVRQLVTTAFYLIDLAPVPGSGIVADQVGRLINDALSEEIAAMAGSAAAESASRATWAGASASIGNASSGTRDSLVDSLRPWIDRIDVSHSALLAQKGGDVELYLESLTGNYDSIVKEARDEAGDA